MLLCLPCLVTFCNVFCCCSFIYHVAKIPFKLYSNFFLNFSIENKAGFTLSYLGDFELEFLSNALSLGFGKLLASDRIKFAL